MKLVCDCGNVIVNKLVPRRLLGVYNCDECKCEFELEVTKWVKQ